MTDLNKEEALEFLNRVSAGIACMFGNSCETLIHDMVNKKSSIISIHHGEVTKRKVGDSLSILGVKEVDEFFEGKDTVNCLGKTTDGRLLKSSTFHLRGEGYHYAFGINYDYTHLSLAKAALEELTAVGQPIEDELYPSGNLLQDIFDECLKIVGKPVALLTKEDRMKMIDLLTERGAFNFAKGIPNIAEKLNISRYTIYKYLRERS
ncbi:helix-turn-helix transcriptional regulator [Sporomusa sp.]|uniref:helix-turn-helix transcriptional regulator n=1 Tax=Sporomusa sp. TaxID=2078658 RepID=UPI002B5EC928|nr:helix-turn-helix transcriptional regulator [Sporomusa sp.]HWR45490.1 helix-turn-helix transcriptional regulator [Sporomusa sp.]